MVARRVRIAALGGGTGLPSVLRGLKSVLFPHGADDLSRLTAIVAVTDDGGSSGRLREELGTIAPGDLRNCLVALSQNEPLMERVFQARYRDGETLNGHSVGNLILAALAQEEQGNFLAAVRLAGDVLNIQGRVLPSTLVPARLVARMADGARVVGESALQRRDGRVLRLEMEPAAPPAAPGVAEAVRAADVVVMGPGSLYSSILPNLLLPEVQAALHATRAFRVLVVNAMTEKGETGGCGASDHVRAVLDHAGPVLDGVLVATDAICADVLARYEDEGAQRVDAADPALDALVPLVLRRDVLQTTPKVRHDPKRTVNALLAAYKTWSRAEAGLASPGGRP